MTKPENMNMKAATMGEPQKVKRPPFKIIPLENGFLVEREDAIECEAESAFGVRIGYKEIGAPRRWQAPDPARLGDLIEELVGRDMIDAGLQPYIRDAKTNEPERVQPTAAKKTLDEREERFEELRDQGALDPVLEDAEG